MYDNTERNAPPKNMEQFQQPIQFRRLRKRKKSHTVWKWLQSILIAVSLALLVRFFVFDFTTVDGPSMKDTLQPGQKLLVDKLSNYFSEPKRGDIVICSFAGDTENTYIKRIIGLGGEFIKIVDSVVYINNQPLPDEYQIPFTGETANWQIESHEGQGYKIPAGTVFVMGDNRDISYDSRLNGYVTLQAIQGKVLAVIWPLKDFGTVK